MSNTIGRIAINIKDNGEIEVEIMGEVKSRKFSALQYHLRKAYIKYKHQCSAEARARGREELKNVENGVMEKEEELIPEDVDISNVDKDTLATVDLNDTPDPVMDEGDEQEEQEETTTEDSEEPVEDEVSTTEEGDEDE